MVDDLIARDQIRLGCRRLADKYPLLGGLISSLRNDFGDHGGTVGLTFNNGRILLQVDRSWAIQADIGRVAIELHHVINHLLFGHHLLAEDRYPRIDLLTLSCDLCVNESLPGRLPAHFSRLSSYPQLPAHEDAVQRYERLVTLFPAPEETDQEQQSTSSGGQCQSNNSSAKNQEADNNGDSEQNTDTEQNQEQSSEVQPCPSAGPGPGGALSNRSQASSPSNGSSNEQRDGDKETDNQEIDNGSEEEEVTDSKQDQSNGSFDDQCDSEKATETRSTKHTVNAEGESDGQSQETTKDTHFDSQSMDKEEGDFHQGWDSLRENQALVQQEIQSVINAVLPMIELTACERKTIWRANAQGPGYGNGTWSIVQSLSGTPHAEQVPWNRLLRRYVGKYIPERVATFTRPPRRFPSLFGVIPGLGSLDSRPRILVALDTSGSMTEELLADLSQELRHLARDRDITVTECDVMIHRTYPFRRAITNAQGRGGTDYHPPLEAGFLRARRAELVIYVTDGDGSAPENPPIVPVVWLLISDLPSPAPWGHVVRYRHPKWIDSPCSQPLGNYGS